MQPNTDHFRLQSEQSGSTPDAHAQQIGTPVQYPQFQQPIQHGVPQGLPQGIPQGYQQGMPPQNYPAPQNYQAPQQQQQSQPQPQQYNQTYSYPPQNQQYAFVPQPQIQQGIMINPQQMAQYPQYQYPAASHATSRYSQTLHCKNCKRPVETMVDYKVGNGAYVIGGLVAAVGLWLGCCFIPCLMEDCKDANHHCPNCGTQIGKKKFLFE